jgi:hypothetical protein
MVELEKLKEELLNVANDKGISLDSYELEHSIKKGFEGRARERINEANKLNYSFEEYSYSNGLKEDYSKILKMENTIEQDKAISSLIEKTTPKVRSEQILSKYGLESVDSWTLKRTNALMYALLEGEKKTQFIQLKKDTLVFHNVLRVNYTGEEYYKADFNQFVKDIQQLIELNGLFCNLPLIPNDSEWTLKISAFSCWENDNVKISLFKNRNVKIKFKLTDGKVVSLLNGLYKEKYMRYGHFLVKE